MIASHIGASQGAVGRMVTMPGLVAAVAAPGLIVGAGRLDRRALLWAMSGLLITSNLIVALGNTLPVLLIGRALLGIGVGGFWAIGAAVSGRLVSPNHSGFATSLVFAGISGGTILGLPIGTFLATALGWHLAFAAATGLCVLALLAQIFLLPRLPPQRTVDSAQLPALLRRSQVRLGLMAVVFVVVGQFAAYTYITPFLEQRASIPPAAISGVLFANGIAGLIGNLLAGYLTQRALRPALIGFGLLLALAILLLPLIGTTPAAATVVVTIWGFAFGGIPVGLQILMSEAAATFIEGGTALFVSTFQISIAAGALVGGVVVDRLGLPITMIFGGALSIIMVAIIGLIRVRTSLPHRASHCTGEM
jgi:predicted MFS family arabinose efflux permease